MAITVRNNSKQKYLDKQIEGRNIHELELTTDFLLSENCKIRN